MIVVLPLTQRPGDPENFDGVFSAGSVRSDTAPALESLCRDPLQKRVIVEHDPRA